MNIGYSIWAWVCSHLRRLLLGFAGLLICGSTAVAHPHVFVDGGVSFRFRDGDQLEALLVTWRYDKFETLYILSSHGLGLNPDGTLDEADRQELIRLRSNWPDDFDGSAHLSIDGVPVELEWPTKLDLTIVDGRLQATFERVLTAPRDLNEGTAEVGFYESTYFFAFSVTDQPALVNASEACEAQVTPFDPDGQDKELQSALAKLGREETPEINNVGALFADRITVSCGN